MYDLSQKPTRGVSMIANIVAWIEDRPYKHIILGLTIIVAIVYVLLLQLLFRVAQFNDSRVVLTMGTYTESISIWTMADYSPPLVFLFNQIVLSISGPRLVFVVHALYAILSFAVSFVILRKIGSPKTGLVIFAVFLLGHLVWQEAVFECKEMIPLGLVLLTLFVIIVSDLSLVKRFTLLGAVAGLGWLTRKTAVILIPMILILPFVYSHHNLRQKIYGLIVSVLAFCIVISPWQAYIVTKTGSISLSPYLKGGIGDDPDISTGTFRPVVKGNNTFSADIYPFIDLDCISEVLHDRLGERYKEPSFSRAFSQVYNFISRHPGEFVLLKVKEIILFFLAIQVPFGSGEYHLVNDSVRIVNFKPHHIYRYPLVIFNLVPVLALPVYVLYFLGIGRHPKTDKECLFKRTLIILTGFYLFLHLIVWVEVGYILPMHPLWLICGSFYLGRVIEFHWASKR
jgi:hypothetical protein